MLAALWRRDELGTGSIVNLSNHLLSRCTVYASLLSTYRTPQVSRTTFPPLQKVVLEFRAPNTPPPPPTSVDTSHTSHQQLEQTLRTQHDCGNDIDIDQLPPLFVFFRTVVGCDGVHMRQSHPERTSGGHVLWQLHPAAWADRGRREY